MSIVEVLQRVPFFAALSSEQLHTLAQMGHTLTLAAGDFIFQQGDHSDYMVIILRGQIRVFLRNQQALEVTLQSCAVGDYLGELALLDDQPRSASALCLSDCELFVLEQPAFRQLLIAHPTLMFGVVAALTRRVRGRTEEYYQSQLAKELLQKEAELERHRTLAQMVAGVAHELNTPLGVANTAAGMIESRLHSALITSLVQDNRAAQGIFEEVDEAAQLLKRNLARAHTLVQNFKQIAVGQLTDKLETVPLPQLIQEIVDLFKINARRAGLHINIRNAIETRSGEATTQWTGYPGHLTQILLNLLSNIERYAYPGSISGGSVGGAVEITLTTGELKQQPTFSLTVRDFGRGIAPEHLPHVFDPFFTTGRGLGGSGLGLAIVYNLVTESLRGAIQIDAQVGQGTVVTVTFPQVCNLETQPRST